MAFESNFVTMIGNLVDDPDLRFTGGGAAVCNMRIASNRRYSGRDGQQQEETTFMDVVAWRDLGENVAQSLRKGDRIIVIGRLQVRDYEDRDGNRRWVTEIQADEIAPSLRWATARTERVNRSGGGGPSSSGGPSGGSGGGPGADYGTPPDMDDVPF